MSVNKYKIIYKTPTQALLEGYHVTPSGEHETVLGIPFKRDEDGYDDLIDYLDSVDSDMRRPTLDEFTPEAYMRVDLDYDKHIVMVYLKTPMGRWESYELYRNREGYMKIQDIESLYSNTEVWTELKSKVERRKPTMTEFIGATPPPVVEMIAQAAGSRRKKKLTIQKRSKGGRKKRKQSKRKQSKRKQSRRARKSRKR